MKGQGEPAAPPTSVTYWKLGRDPRRPCGASFEIGGASSIPPTLAAAARQAGGEARHCNQCKPGSSAMARIGLITSTDSVSARLRP